ncbi:MAG: type II toxin-antitoxin system prevent-host-death family antitoxin [Caldilineaceae bacterium]
MQTLTVREAETQLQSLVKQAQTTQRPVFLTNEVATPMAVLLDSAIYEALQGKERQLFQLQLRHLLQQINAAEAQWDDQQARQTFITDFPASTYTLWKACPESAQDMCIVLDLAACRLSLETLSRQQLAALRQCLLLLQDGGPDDATVELCEQQLIEAGLPPIMGGSDSLVALYMDEL